MQDESVFCSMVCLQTVNHQDRLELQPMQVKAHAKPVAEIFTTPQHGNHHCTCAACLGVTYPNHRALPLRAPSPCRGREGRPLCPFCLSRQMLTMQALCGLMQCCCIGFTVMQSISCSSSSPLRLQPNEHVLQLPDSKGMLQNVQAKSCHEVLSVN